jgi:hypothetical protein
MQSPLAEAGNHLAAAFDIFLASYTEMQFGDGEPPNKNRKVETKIALVAFSTKAIQCFVELLNLAAPATPLRNFLASVIENFPVTTANKKDLKAMAQGFWKRYPNCILDERCSRVAFLLEQAIGKLHDEMNSVPRQGSRNRAWDSPSLPEKQQRLMKFLDGKDFVSTGDVALKIWGQEIDGLPKKTVDARLRKLVLDTKNNFLKLGLKYQIENRRPSKTHPDSAIRLRPYGS